MIGDAVNLAAKLEKHNKTEKTRALCMADVYVCACEQGYVAAAVPEIRKARIIEGVTRPRDLCVLV